MGAQAANVSYMYESWVGHWHGRLQPESARMASLDTDGDPVAWLPQLILAMLLDEGDLFLVEEYTYSHILESVAEPKGYVPIGVPMDRDGILPDALRQVRGSAHRPPAVAA